MERLDWGQTHTTDHFHVENPVYQQDSRSQTSVRTAAFSEPKGEEDVGEGIQRFPVLLSAPHAVLAITLR